MLHLPGRRSDHVAADLAPTAAAIPTASKAGPLEDLPNGLVQRGGGGRGLSAGQRSSTTTPGGGDGAPGRRQRAQVGHRVGGGEEAHPTLAVDPAPIVAAG